MGLGKRKTNTGKIGPSRKIHRTKERLPIIIFFISYGLNTKFEHKSVNTGGYHWRLQ